MCGRLRRTHLGERGRARPATDYFEIELGLETAQQLLGRIGVDQIGAEGLPNFLDREVQDCDARITFGSSKINNAIVLRARECCLELLQGL
jgi:hypothetical protein